MTDKQAAESARIRQEQDDIIDKFVQLWHASNLTERKQLPYRIVRSRDGNTYIRDQQSRVVGQIDTVRNEFTRCVWIRSLDDLKQIRDLAGVVV